ncbi:serine/arginine repetitive matrix-like protein [Wolffia australiana]
MFRQSSATLLQQQQRRDRSRSIGKEPIRADEALDLFSTTRRSASIVHAEALDGKKVAPNLARISIGSAKAGRRGLDDLLSAGDTKKHDYDWLLTPPGSPLHSSRDSMEAPHSSAASRSTRSASVTKTSRITPPQSSTNTRTISRIPARATAERSGSVARAAIHVARAGTPVTGGAGRAASARPLTPATRSKPPPQTAISRSTAGHRPATPAKTRPIASRPSTPTARPQLSVSGHRPSTPTRRVPTGGSAAKPVPPVDFPSRARPPERPVSAGRSRPRLPLSAAPPPENAPRCNSISPARPWLQTPKQKPAAAEPGGFGRSLSKKSLDVAIRHMDLRQGMAGVRGAALFPHSVRAAPPPEKAAPPPPPPPREAAFLGRAIGRDVFESSRYDAILLKEDVRNMSWLHSGEDKHDHGLFDLRLEPLPEPFVI